MAITQSPTPNKTPDNKSQKTKKRVVASVWLIMALLSGAAALALWMFSSAPAFDEKTEEAEQQTEETVANTLGQVTNIDELNELSAEVHPISFDALVRDLRDYPPEFKDSKYLKKNKGKWTIQVMDVSEHEIITDYLNSRDDREKFAYFRYRDESDQPRYLLTYGVVDTEKLAEGTAAAVDFDLPLNVRVIPEEISTYLDVIENYELSAPIKDLSSNRTRQVRLQPTKRELAVRRQAPAPRQSSNDDNDDSNNSQRSSSSNQSQPTSSPIRNSNDTSDTLSVQEERKVIVEGEQSSSGSSSSSNNTNETPPANNPSETRNNSANTQNGNAQNAARPRNETSARPQQNTPATPVPPTRTAPAPTNNRPANSSNNASGSNNNASGSSNNGNAAGGNDSIGQLIEEKTQ